MAVMILYFRYGHGFLEIRAFKQLMQYPGNEQCLALSADAYYNLYSEEQSDLRHKCRAAGIGLLVVDFHERAFVLQAPRSYPTPLKREDWLTAYSRGGEIREQIRTSTSRADG